MAIESEWGFSAATVFSSLLISVQIIGLRVFRSYAYTKEGFAKSVTFCPLQSSNKGLPHRLGHTGVESLVNKKKFAHSPYYMIRNNNKKHLSNMETGSRIGPLTQSLVSLFHAYLVYSPTPAFIRALPCLSVTP